MPAGRLKHFILLWFALPCSNCAGVSRRSVTFFLNASALADANNKLSMKKCVCKQLLRLQEKREKRAIICLSPCLHNAHFYTQAWYVRGAEAFEMESQRGEVIRAKFICPLLNFKVFQCSHFGFGFQGRNFYEFCKFCCAWVLQLFN